MDKPHGLTGRKAAVTVLTGFTGIIDSLLRSGISNSSVCYDRLKENGYTGGLTAIKDYIAAHRDLVPAKRQIVAPQGNRGRRYQTAPGEAYQMDWGFVEVETQGGSKYKVACFAMICHFCGKRYIEFFPNARQENLFIGMLHAFMYMGIPDYILTDNMKSVVVRRDSEGHPIISESKMYAFLSDVAETHDTSWMMEQYREGLSSTVIINDNSRGDGSIFDIDSEFEYLKAEIISGNYTPEERELQLSKNAVSYDAATELGNTYIEVNMGEQMLYYYVDGQLSMNTGKTSERFTGFKTYHCNGCTCF